MGVEIMFLIWEFLPAPPTFSYFPCYPFNLLLFNSTCVLIKSDYGFYLIWCLQVVAQHNLSLTLSFNLVLTSSSPPFELSIFFFFHPHLQGIHDTHLLVTTTLQSLSFIYHELFVTSSSPFVHAISSSIYTVTYLFLWLIVFWVIRQDAVTPTFKIQFGFTEFHLVSSSTYNGTILSKCVSGYCWCFGATNWVVRGW